MRLWALFSGGKDSVSAVHRAVEQGHEVVKLISVVSRRDDSYMFHVPNIELSSRCAEALGIPYIRITVSGEKEAEVEELEGLLREAVSTLPEEERPQGLLSGALASEYQEKRIGALCSRMGFTSVTPLWRTDPKKYMRSLVEEGYEILVVGVFAEGMAGFLGKTFDGPLLEKLFEVSDRYGVHPGGEGGEFETFVLDAPLYRYRIKVESFQEHKKRDSGEIEIKSVSLLEK